MGMAENYKHLYEQTKKMLAMYQDELVPGFRKQIEELEKNQVKVRCKDCLYYIPKVDGTVGFCKCGEVCGYLTTMRVADDFCSYGERKDNDDNY